jgi:O-antigen ligase
MSLSVFLLLVATLLTFSRGALVSLPLSIGVFILFSPSRKVKVALLSGMAALTVGIYVLSQIINIPVFSRFFNQDISTLNGRTFIWQALLSHYHPEQLLGNGLHASNTVLTNLYGGQIVATAPSNLFIGTLYDHGIMGLILLILIFTVLFITVVRGIRKTTGEQRLLFIVALTILVSVLLQSLEVDDFLTQTIGIYFWIIVALPFALCWSRPHKESDASGDISDRPTEPRMETIPQATRERIFTSSFTG